MRDPSEVIAACPFCGGEASVNTCRTSDREYIRLNGRDHGFGVNCVSCGVNNRGIAYGYATEAEAITAWNRRTTPQPASADPIRQIIDSHAQGLREHAEALYASPPPASADVVALKALLREAIGPAGADFCMNPALEAAIEAALNTGPEG